MGGAKRFIALGGIFALVLATLSGCFLLPEDTAGQEDWYIRLNIGKPAAGKVISVGEYEVTEVNIEVYGPGEDQSFYTVNWRAESGSASYLIPVKGQGQYRLAVTHISDGNGKIVEAEESAIFDIYTNVITVIDIIPGCIGTIGILGESENPATEEYGSLMLTLSPAGMAAKTVVPTLDMNIEYYDVCGDGPDSNRFTRSGIPGPTIVESSLVVGEWTITVRAFNSDNHPIGYGSVNVTITAGQLTQSEVSITPLEGRGGLDIIVSWPEATVIFPVVAGTLVAEDGVPDSLSFLPGENSASCTMSDLDVGYYTMILQLFDGEDLVWGFIDAVRILKDQRTEAVYNLSF